MEMKGGALMTLRRSLRLLPLFTLMAGSFGIGVLISSKMLSQAAQADAPRPPWVRPDGTVDMSAMPACVNIAGPDGEPIKGRDGKPLCVPYGSWEDKNKFKQLTPEEEGQLPPEQRKKVRRFSDGTLWLIGEPKRIDYRYFLKKEGLPDTYKREAGSDSYTKSQP